MFGNGIPISREGFPSRFIFVFGSAILLMFNSGCGKDEDDSPSSSCYDGSQSAGTGAEGRAEVFSPDPLSSSGDANLSPQSASLDEFKSDTGLTDLGGKGLLEGSYVDVRDGLTCAETYGAYSASNDFRYSHSERQFQEAMSYAYGTSFRKSLSEAGALEPKGAVRVVAHCMKEDNAYYTRGRTSSSVSVTEKVCLGDSSATEGASYADDASVVVHELQHATTAHAYSEGESLNQFWSDEAGALNEAVSDFMALMHLEPTVTRDPRVFSPWALGMFIPQYSGERGANRCSVYDPGFPNCAHYRNGPSGFSADQNHVSYSYPDGVGWPYADNFAGPGKLRSVFTTYGGQEEIHSNAVVMTGALWDAYEGLKSAYAGDRLTASRRMQLLVIESLRALPKPTVQNRSPVSFRGFAQLLAENAAGVGISSGGSESISTALSERGLLGGSLVTGAWAGVGPGQSATPGMAVEDNPTKLKTWIVSAGGSASLITQGISTGLNARLDRGEVAAIWFDVANASAVTAGGVRLTARSLNPDVTFLDSSVNFGAVNESSAQVQLHKINGTAIVSALSSSNGTYHVPTSSTYFGTNPGAHVSYKTALWVKVSSEAAAGSVAAFELTLEPTNGDLNTITVSTAIL